MNIEKIPRKNLSDLIADNIRQDIVNGKLKPGDRLPPHESLCKQWDVSRVTLREALNKLAVLGLVEIHQGRGTFIREINSQFFQKQFEFHLILDQKTELKLLEARKVIETSLVRFAAERCEKNELKSLEILINQMKETVAEDDLLKYAVIDFKFHKLIGVLAKNDILYLMLEKIQYFMENQQRDMFAYSREQGINLIERTFQDHKEIFQMISKRDPNGAVNKMSKHISRIEQIVKSFYRSKGILFA